MTHRINLAYNLETSDPDDALTLCFLGSHPKVNLCAVTVNPGTNEQVGLVKCILKQLNLDIPVGSRKIGYEKNCVSAFHYKWFSKFDLAKPDDQGWVVLNEAYQEHQDLVILSGAPLGNIYDFMVNAKPIINELVIQGGFAGASIVPPECILEKFTGKETCPTFNLGGDKDAALFITQDKIISKNQYYISKNVCHGLCYDKKFHYLYMAEHKNDSVGMFLIHSAMTKYLDNKPEGKLFHDPLAACAAIDKSVCDFRQVELYRTKGEWGCNLSEDSNKYISVKLNKEQFINVFFQKKELNDNIQ